MPHISGILILPLFGLAASLIYFTSSAQEKAPKPDFDMTAMDAHLFRAIIHETGMRSRE